MIKRFAMSVVPLSLVLGLVSPTLALAATTPTLGAATSFAVLGGTYTNTTAGTIINGDIGYTTGPAVVPTISGVTHIGDATYTQAGIDQGAALVNLNNQPCTFSFAPGAIDLAVDTTHGAVGVYAPGVYCTTGAASIGAGGVTLSGVGTYVFRVSGALTTVANASVTLAGGASACNVFWTPTQATTLGANTAFAGTLLGASGITVGANTTWLGRSLAFGGTVTTNLDTITAPTCVAAATPTPTPTPTATASPIATPTPTPTALPTQATTPSATPVPGLPSAGTPPGNNSNGVMGLIGAGVLVIALTSLSRTLKKRSRLSV